MQLGPHTLYSMMSRNFLCQPGECALAFFRDLRPREMAACPRLCCQDRLLFYCFLEMQVASPLLALISFERTRMSHSCQMFS